MRKRQRLRQSLISINISFAVGPIELLQLFLISLLDIIIRRYLGFLQFGYHEWTENIGEGVGEGEERFDALFVDSTLPEKSISA